MIIVAGHKSDVGRTRAANEDSFLRDDEALVFAVADGMGGHRAGDVASSTALEVLESHFGETGDLVTAIEVANAEIFTRAQADPELRGMGTTVTALRVEGETAHVAHVGDSRAYLLRDGELTRVTDDHSLVEELVREGRLTPEEAAVHPQRSIITRALGVDEAVVVDTYEVDLRVGDRVLVCSDGLTSMLRDEEIAPILRQSNDPQQAADALVEAANRAGGEDNITVVILDATGDKEEARAKAVAASAAIPPSADEPTGEWTRAEPPEVEVPEAEPARDGGRTIRRALLWIVPLVAVLTIALVALAWYARGSYYVGSKDGRVALYQGVPGGFLIWDATLEEETDIRVDALSDTDRTEVREGHETSSKGKAQAYIRRLSASTTSTTSTTTPPVPTSQPSRPDDGRPPPTVRR
ncbi:MAG: Stp1/IreP family PP2C-type Ser/Thr phosphatase [Actinobacteria bacterium]|nr:Stp1/IreP family PP2C-type Ser/Thr phosphatase [Actinomycetota bacterium]